VHENDMVQYGKDSVPALHIITEELEKETDLSVCAEAAG